MSEKAPTPACGILVVDDDASMAYTLRRFLEQEEYAVEVALSGAEALEIFGQKPCINLALIDLAMPLMDGLTLLDHLRQRNPDIAVIIMTGFGTIETAVEAMKRGAEDYITKPLDPDSVLKKVGRLREVLQLRTRVAQLEDTIKEFSPSFESLVCVSPVMQKVVERARSIAQTDAAILLVGETGTGKEVLARAIHEASGRHAAPFVPVNCGALPRELVESELFGARRGAYTGAYTDSPGMFASANRGTIFLDEIGEMPKDIQVKLLRVLQDKEFRPVGSTKSFPIDIRVMAATNRPLTVLRGEYMRADLYYRIATVVLEVPPLRARPEDLFVLAQHLLKRLSERYGREIQLSRAAWELLLRHSFPGNVRELQNVLEAVAVFGRDNPQIFCDKELRPLLQDADLTEGGTTHANQPIALEPLERIAIQRALRLARGNRSKAASLLGISRDTLYRKLREYSEATLEPSGTDFPIEK